MSTRSILAFDTEKGVRGVYVHSDGYPDGEMGRLNQVSILIARDGISKVATTVLEHSHWAYLFSDRTEDSLVIPGDILVLGYGAWFETEDKNYFTPDQLKEYWDSEYVYLVDSEGQVRWADIGVGHDDLTWESLQWRTGVPVSGDA